MDPHPQSTGCRLFDEASLRVVVWDYLGQHHAEVWVLFKDPLVGPWGVVLEVLTLNTTIYMLIYSTIIL